MVMLTAPGRNIHWSINTSHLNIAHAGHPVPLMALFFPSRPVLLPGEGRMVSNFQQLKPTPKFANIKLCFTAKWTINFQDLEQNCNSTPSYRCCGHKDSQYILPWKTVSNYFCKKKLPGKRFHLVLRKISPEAMQPPFHSHFPVLPQEGPPPPGSLK